MRQINNGIAGLVLLAISLSAQGLGPMTFDSHGRWIGDGKPRFALGLYVSEEPRHLPDQRGAMLARLDDIANSPFRLLVDYGNPFGVTASRIEVLDEMHKRGLSAFISLEGIYPDRWFAQGAPLAGRTLESALGELIDPVKHHPAVLGWYICDEYPDPQLVQEASQVVRKADPGHPILVCSNHRTADKLRGFVDATDILAVDDYPIPQRPIERVAQTMSEMANATNHTMPRWAIIQGCGNYVYNEDVRERGARLDPQAIRGDARMPTPREMRCMTFLALTQDVTGILFYYYRDYQLAYDAKQRWDAVKTIAEEVNKISPMLLAEASDDAVTCDEKAIRFRVTQSGDARYVIAVNASQEVRSGILTFPSSMQQAELVTGSGLAYLKDKSLLLTLDGYEAVVVQVR